MIMVILNGKRACLPAVRQVISTVRREVEGIQVRVTYEYGDVERFMHEALSLDIGRIVIGGGDGSLSMRSSMPWPNSRESKDPNWASCL